MKPLVKAVTTAVNAAPITMPTARSTTLPRMMKSLKPWKNLFTSTLQHAEGGFGRSGSRCPPPVGDKLRRFGPSREAQLAGRSVEGRFLRGDRLVDRRVGAQHLHQAAHLEDTQHTPLRGGEPDGAAGVVGAVLG